MAAFPSEIMRRRSFPIMGLIVFGGVALGFAAFAANSNLPEHNIVPRAPFQPSAATHKTLIASQGVLEFPNANEVRPRVETVSSVPPTRSSFMATWEGVSGAKGYLLDVSTNDSFSSYADGYHDLDVGKVSGRAVTGLSAGTTYYYRVRPYPAAGSGGYSNVMTATTEAATGLIINATFDNSIIGNPNAAAIEAMINRSIGIYESLFSDPITIQILFRYSTTEPDGTPLPSGLLAESDYVVYNVPWNDFISALRGDARTSNDNMANASLPGSALSTNIMPSSANGRSVGFDTPPSMFANGTVGNGGPYDGIVTLNSTQQFQFTRPPSSGSWDAQSGAEHEIDEIIGLGSRLNTTGNDLRPQDLFSWSSAGIRNITSSGTRYFSIDGGVIDIVGFNQDPSSDFGDWLSDPCPQTYPYVQNAFGCSGQYSDISATSPEGINFDVVGYDLVNAPTPTPAFAGRAIVDDFNGDGHPDWVLQNSGTRQTAAWYLNNNVFIGGAFGPIVAAGWTLRTVADFNRDGHPDYALFAPSTYQTAIWYLSGPALIGAAYGPTLPSSWQLVATGDFNGDSSPDYVLSNINTRQTVIGYLNNNVVIDAAFGPTLPSGWNLIGVADFNGDGHPDYALFISSTGQTVIGYLSGPAVIGVAVGPTCPSGWALVATADFNGDGHPDYLLYNAGSRQTAIWYLNDNVFVSAAYGPTIPAGWSLAAP
ncbi:MAG: NF038122 family metalloprotease [Candidatus Udaeobacter sp.]